MLRLAAIGPVAAGAGAEVAVDAVVRSCAGPIRLTLLGAVIDPDLAESWRRRADRAAGFELQFAGAPSPDELDRHLMDVDLLLVPDGDPGTTASAARGAWSRGIPVLASRRTAAARQVREGENGFTYPLDDPDELAVHIRRLASEPALLDRIRAGALRASEPRSRHGEVFTDIYARQAWRLGGESASGPGSRREQTHVLRAELPALLGRLGVGRLLDLGCGDFNWMRDTELPIDLYIGVDVVREVILSNRRRYGGPGRRFLHRDLTRDRLPAADLVLCRDVLIHFPNHELQVALDAIIATGARYLLAGTFIGRECNDPIELGEWRPVNLELPPLSLPPPLETILETPDVPGYEDKRLGLWDLNQLRARC